MIVDRALYQKLLLRHERQQAAMSAALQPAADTAVGDQPPMHGASHTAGNLAQQAALLQAATGSSRVTALQPDVDMTNPEAGLQRNSQQRQSA